MNTLHCDEGLLIDLASGSGMGVESDATAHLESCDECQCSLSAYRILSDAAADAETWAMPSEVSVPEAPLRALQQLSGRLANEDAVAGEQIEMLLDGPRQSWMERLQQRPDLRTAGIVRRLIGEVDRRSDTSPKDVLEITALCVEIAEHLQSDVYPRGTLCALRGAAWRDRAYALFRVGDLNGALTAVDVAEQITAEGAGLAHELARVWLVKALILRLFDKSEESVALSRKSALVFAEFGDLRRVGMAKWSEALVLYRLRRLPEALDAWLEQERVVEDGDEISRATLLVNIASCCIELGRVEETASYARKAAPFLAANDLPEISVRLSWVLARLAAAQSQFDDAIARFKLVRGKLQLLGLQREADTAALEEVELQVILDRPAQAAVLCRAVIANYEKDGLAHTPRAFAALNYLNEAIAMGKVTPAVVRTTREYISRLPSEPNLLFAPPPL